MNARQNSYLQMFAAVKATSDAHSTAWSTFAPFATPYAAFEALLLQADTALAQQSITSAGTTEAKAALRESLSDKLLRISHALVLHAGVTSNQQLAGDAKTAPSDLKVRMREKAFIGHGTKIMSLANALPASTLAPYAVNTAFLTGTAADLQTFTEMIGTPRHIQAESIRGTQVLDEVIEDIIDILEDKMDPAADVLQYTQDAFYSEYITSREIIDAGSDSEALRVTTNNNQDEPIPNVSGAINPGNIQKVTGQTGRFSVQSLADGDYTLQLLAPGYVTRNETFTIAGNDTLELTYVMQTL